MIEGHLLSERYLIQKTIGGGGMANVYLATDTILNREVAIKVLRLEYANDEEFIARFDREAQAATSLSHPNIVNIFDVGEEAHILYMVMEYVAGMTLKEYIQYNGPVEVTEAIGIMKQITAAIGNAHENDLIHRDIKPQNILMDTYGQVKVTDFGIAIALSATSLTQTNMILGSVHYLSPEQARGGTATKKSDIYSLGIVFFELLTGRLPFSGQSPVSIALKHLQSNTPSVKRFNSAIPQSVENIVLKAMAKDPFHRYETVYDLGEALEVALHPNKLNEAVYTPPIEVGEETKAIPIITDDQIQENVNQDTIIHKTEEQTKTIEKSKKKPKKKSRKKKWLISFFIILALLTSVVLAVFIFPNLLQPKEVMIPDVFEMEHEEAVISLESKKLIVKEETINSEEIEEGFAVKTSPKSGRTVKEESVVTLFISAGKQTTVFSDYVGRNFNQAERLLIESGYKEEDIIAYEKHSEKPIGEIITQVQPAAGSEVVPSDTQVIFEVSSGLELGNLSNLKGLTETEAKESLEKQGFTMNKVEESSDDIKKGNVIKHHPEANTSLKKGTAVDVYISLGAKEKPPSTHDVSFTVPYSPVTGEEEKPPQKVLIYIDDMEHDLSEVYEEEMITEDKEYSITLKIAPDKHAEYKVMRGDEVLINETIAYEEGG